MAIFFKDRSPAEVQVFQDGVLWAKPGLGNCDSLPRGKNRLLANLKRPFSKRPWKGLKDRNYPFCAIYIVPASHKKLYLCYMGS